MRKIATAIYRTAQRLREKGPLDLSMETLAMHAGVYSHDIHGRACLRLDDEMIPGAYMYMARAWAEGGRETWRLLQKYDAAKGEDRDVIAQDIRISFRKEFSADDCHLAAGKIDRIRAIVQEMREEVGEKEPER